jgi:hypothetical protein
MQAVHFTIRTWTQIATPLRDKGENVEELLPERIHIKHPMRSIAMQKERLRKNG